MANEQRLALLRYLLLHSECRVSVIAKDLDLSVSSASQHLRALNARGFLMARRVGRHVFYRVGCDDSMPETAAILAAVSNALRARARAAESVYRTVTACTHPRRLDILRSLGHRDLTLSEMKQATGVSRSALRRHLLKLKARGFVAVSDDRFSCRKLRDPLSRTLLRLAIL